jgi:Rv2258c-like winged HTH domain
MRKHRDIWEMDEVKLHQFMGQMLSDLGGAASVALVRIGDALGLYKILHQRGPMTVAELAAAAGVNERYLREWLSHQAASNYVTYDTATQKFTLPQEQALIFADENSPVYLQGAFDLMTWITESKDQVEAVFKTGAGVPWSDHTSCFFLRGGALFPARLPQQPSKELAARP